MPEQQEPSPREADIKFASELRGMRNRAFLVGERYKLQHKRANRAPCHPKIIEFERKLVSRMAKLGVPVFCHCAYRSPQDQDSLFVQGFSKAKGGQSPHNHGFAVDVVHSTRAWDLTRKQWDIIGHVGKEVAASIGVQVDWGGDWDFYDPAHWEMANWRDIGVKT